MGKEVVVKCNVEPHHNAYRDITVGGAYLAYLPEEGERDKDGLDVSYDDELWILADDVGEGVVGRLSDGFEVVGYFTLRPHDTV